jgi:hypothetical protein
MERQNIKLNDLKFTGRYISFKFREYYYNKLWKL